MPEKEGADLERWMRNLRLIALVPLLWIVLCVIIPDFVFNLVDYNNPLLMVFRHGMAMIFMAIAVIYLLLQIKSQRGLPCLWSLAWSRWSSRSHSVLSGIPISWTNTSARFNMC